MSNAQNSNQSLKPIGYELFIGALSILSIVNLVLIYAVQDDEVLVFVIGVINVIMTPIFLGDFLYRFLTAETRSDYFLRDFGWADLLSSLPFPQFKVLRLFRLWRVFRLFRSFGVKNLVSEFITHRAENALLTVVFLVICVLEFGSLAIASTEAASADANITSASDAIWWTFVTITTVGYGDRFPVTNSGRFVAILVMIAGVGLFGTLSGFLANSFLSPTTKEEAQPESEDDASSSAGATDTNDPEGYIGEIRRWIAAQEQATAEVKARLDELENIRKLPGPKKSEPHHE